ncbi:MAG TPA: hypothetical protein VM782_01265 [Stellaceae bacterium]|nr:hypothetical protein [Stellaceae bacterium]
MTRCRDCGRRKATERQWDHWWNFCQGRRRQPLWWRLKTRCLGWYDCVGAYDREYWDRLTLNWYERRLLQKVGRMSEEAE